MLSLIPRETRFFDLLEEESQLLVRAAEAYTRLAEDFAHRDRHVAEIRDLEHRTDGIARQTFERLDSTFITPFDREDIHALTKKMDDVVDAIDAAAKRLVLYRIETISEWLKRQSGVLLEACRQVDRAVQSLRRHKKAKGLTAAVGEIHRCEKQADDVNYSAVADLFENVADAILVMKWKEIYDLTERATDRCKDIADVIEAIVLKNG